METLVCEVVLVSAIMNSKLHSPVDSGLDDRLKLAEQKSKKKMLWQNILSFLAV